MEFTSLIGKFIANTTLPDSVLLGATAGVAPFHTVKWEFGLQLFLINLIAWITAHTHKVVPLPPLGLVGIPSTEPMGPAAGLLSPMLPLIPSLRVKVGL